MRRSLFLFSLILWSTQVLASPDDSTANKITYRTNIFMFLEDDFKNGNVRKYYPDSSLVNVSKTNPALDLHYNFLGTNGSAGNPQLFDLHPSPYSFSGIHSYDLQQLFSDSIYYYQTNKRFTDFRYHSSAFKELEISVLHSQNLTKNWNAGIFIDRLGVKDFMNFSDTYRGKLSVFSSYQSKNNKYRFFLHAIWNRINNDVNGGLKNDSLFDNTVVGNLGIKGLAYNISNAQERIRSRTLYLSQYYNLSRNDTDYAGREIQKPHSVFIHHEISLTRKSFSYTDSSPDSSFYDNFYYGSTTLDSQATDDIRNKIEILYHSEQQYDTTGVPVWKRLNAGIFVENFHTNYFQRSDSSWTNNSVGAHVGLSENPTEFSFEVDGKYVIDGIDEKNYILNAGITSPDFSSNRFKLHFTTFQNNPDLIFRLHDANNFYWRNDLAQMVGTDAFILYEQQKYKFQLKVRQQWTDNFTYLDEYAFPRQFSKTITVNSFSLLKNFVYRFWHFDNTITYQKTDQEEVLRIPKWVSDQSLYFERKYFKNALLLSTGLSANYNSYYFADAFMPSNGMFFIQNEKQVGGYFRIDAFVAAKIKTARIFLKMENVFDNAGRVSYYLTPHYPMPGRVFKFGLVWWFFDQ